MREVRAEENGIIIVEYKNKTNNYEKEYIIPILQNLIKLIIGK